MNGGCSPSSGRFLAQGTVAEAGGWVDMRSRSWTETLGGREHQLSQEDNRCSG